MSKQFARKDLSALGFFLILGIVLGNLVMIAIMSAAVSIRVAGMILGSGTVPDPAEIMDITASIQGNALFLLVLNTLSVYLVGFGFIYLLMRHRIPSIRAGQGTERRERPGLSLTEVLALIPISVFLMDAGDLIGRGMAQLCGDQIGVEASNRAVEVLLSGNLWQTILFVVILGPAAEELFFRKFLIDRFSGYSAEGTILLSAVTFAIFHQNFFQIFYAGFIGAILAWVYTKTKNVLYPIVLHVGINFFGGVVMPLCMSPVIEQKDALLAMDPAVIGALFREHPESLIFLAAYGTLSLIGMILLLIWVKQRRFRVTETPEALPFKEYVRAYVTAPGQIAYLLVCVALGVFMLVAGS